MIFIFSWLFFVGLRVVCFLHLAVRNYFAGAKCGLRRAAFLARAAGTPYSFFILFLPRGSKRTKQEKEAAAKARQLAVSNEQLAVGRAFSCLGFEALVVLAV